MERTSLTPSKKSRPTRDKPMGRCVLVLSGPDDATTTEVVRALLKRGTAVTRIDTGDFPQEITLDARTSGGEWTGRISTGEYFVDLEDVGSIYYRRPTRFRFPDSMSAGDQVFAAAEARFGVGGVLLSLDALWVNDPGKAALAEYKPHQLRVAGSVGLSVPKTVITNNPETVREFAAGLEGPMVCKPLSSVVLYSGDEPEIAFTTRVDIAGIDPERVSATATQFQEWVPKQYDARVTMVGQRPLAVAIRASSSSAFVDWRRDYSALDYSVVEPPVEVTTGMRRYLDEFGLAYGAFDFVITPDGEWVMLECNPMGQWLWLQEEAGLPVTAALADLLTEGTTE